MAVVMVMEVAMRWVDGVEVRCRGCGGSGRLKERWRRWEAKLNTMVMMTTVVVGGGDVEGGGFGGRVGCHVDRYID